MANVFVEESTLTNIADKIRNKLNSENTYKPSEMPTAIESIVTPVLQEKSVTANGEVVPDEGYNGLSKVTVNVASSGGGGGSSTPTVEGGYTINFYNTDNVLIESHSALAGNWIDAPISYIPNSWVNANGYVNQFPLKVDTAETVIDLYASVTQNCSDALYEIFEIDKETYPYIVLAYATKYNRLGIDVLFTNSIGFNSYNQVTCGSVSKYWCKDDMNTYFTDYTLSNVVRWLQNNMSSLTAKTYEAHYISMPYDGRVVYNTFESDYFTGRLDTELYLPTT